jgi:uncharacterized protein YjdB
VRDQNGATISGASVVWKTSDSSVASVSTTGLVEAEFNGEATVTAKSDSEPNQFLAVMLFASLVDAERYAQNTGTMIISPAEVSQ